MWTNVVLSSLLHTNSKQFASASLNLNCSKDPFREWKFRRSRFQVWTHFRTMDLHSLLPFEAKAQLKRRIFPWKLWAKWPCPGYTGNTAIGGIRQKNHHSPQMNNLCCTFCEQMIFVDKIYSWLNSLIGPLLSASVLPSFMWCSAKNPESRLKSYHASASLAKRPFKYIGHLCLWLPSIFFFQEKSFTAKRSRKTKGQHFFGETSKWFAAKRHQLERILASDKMLEFQAESTPRYLVGTSGNAALRFLSYRKNSKRWEINCLRMPHRWNDMNVRNYQVFNWKSSRAQGNPQGPIRWDTCKGTEIINVKYLRPVTGGQFFREKMGSTYNYRCDDARAISIFHRSCSWVLTDAINN